MLIVLVMIRAQNANNLKLVLMVKKNIIKNVATQNYVDKQPMLIWIILVVQVFYQVQFYVVVTRLFKNLMIAPVHWIINVNITWNVMDQWLSSIQPTRPINICARSGTYAEKRVFTYRNMEYIWAKIIHCQKLPAMIQST